MRTLRTAGEAGRVSWSGRQRVKASGRGGGGGGCLLDLQRGRTWKTEFEESETEAYFAVNYVCILPCFGDVCCLRCLLHIRQMDIPALLSGKTSVAAENWDMLFCCVCNIACSRHKPSHVRLAFDLFLPTLGLIETLTQLCCLRAPCSL